MNSTEYAIAILNEMEEGMDSIDYSKIEELAEIIMSVERIFCDGKGRSGLQIKSFAMRLAQMGFVSYEVSGTTTPAIAAKDLLIISSGSGNTPSLVEHARKATSLGAKVVLLTSSKEAFIAQNSSCVIKIEAQNKIDTVKQSLQPMGTLFEQCSAVVFDSLVLLLMEKMKISNEEMYAKHNNLE